MGEVLAGKFRVDRVLGTGGMGVVVAATHLHLDQTVALKFLLPHSLQNASVVGRFMREARAAVRLRSEHVARVIDVGQLENGAPYIVMEYLDGRDLGDVLEQDGPQSIETAVDYVTQACEAVAEAHALGIIHRDLKPRNLFLARRVDGRPLIKVLDFGISKMATGPSGNELSLTTTAEVVGSPNYMSPEQLRAARLADARSDIWSLGAILYELLCGRVPFVAETLTQLCSMVLTEHPRPMHELRSDIPPQLSHVIARCLEKDPAARFQTVHELVAALAPFLAANAMAQGGTRVLVHGVAAPALAASDRSSTPIVSATGGTSVAWGSAEPGAAPRRRGVVIAVTSLLLVVAIGGAGAATFIAKRPRVAGQDSPSSSAMNANAAGDDAAGASASGTAGAQTGASSGGTSPIASTAASAPSNAATSASAPIATITPPASTTSTASTTGGANAGTGAPSSRPTKPRPTKPPRGGTPADDLPSERH